MDSIRTSTRPATEPPTRRNASPTTTTPRSDSGKPRSDRATVSREGNSAPSSQPINFGSWAKPGRALTQGVQAPSEIKSLQQALNRQGAQLSEDGKFGDATEKAVREFQTRHQLESDGKVGQGTASKLQSGSAGPPASKPANPAKPANSADPAGKPVAPGAARKPVDSFAFSSDPLDSKSVRNLVDSNRSKGKTTMIGIDPNNEAEEQQKIAKIARQGGAQTHKYLEGRGGPTGDGPGAKWDTSEKNRTADLARREGIPLKSFDDRDPAMRKWNQEGWQNQSIRQAREAKGEGHSSVEVDNINRDLKGQDNSDEAKAKRAMEFYGKYAKEFAKGDMPTLMLKNLSEAELKAVSGAIQNSKTLPREMFSDFAINEYDGRAKGSDRQEIMADLERRERMTRQLGIQPLRSGDTRHYAASGNFR